MTPDSPLNDNWNRTIERLGGAEPCLDVDRCYIAVICALAVAVRGG
jgi:hypothetical protein